MSQILSKKPEVEMTVVSRSLPASSPVREKCWCERSRGKLPKTSRGPGWAMLPAPGSSQMCSV